MKKLIVWTILLAGLGYVGAKMYIHNRVSSALDNLLIMTSPFANVTYSGVSSTMGGTLSVDDIEVRVNGYSDPVSAEKVSIVTPGFWYLLDLGKLGANPFGNDVPDELGFEIIGFHSNTDSDLMKMMYRSAKQQAPGEDAMDAAAECTAKYGYSPKILLDLGYRELVADMQMGYRKKGNDMVVDVTTSVADMYDMQFEFTVDGAMSPQALMMGSYRPKLVDARLQYVDRSLNDRTTELCTRAGLTAEEVMAAKLDAFHTFGEKSGIVFDEEIVEPYREFLAGKDTFVMTAKPHEPLNMSQIDLYKPSDIPALLNLTAEAR